MSILSAIWSYRPFWGLIYILNAFCFGLNVGTKAPHDFFYYCNVVAAVLGTIVVVVWLTEYKNERA